MGTTSWTVTSLVLKEATQLRLPCSWLLKLCDWQAQILTHFAGSVCDFWHSYRPDCPVNPLDKVSQELHSSGSSLNSAGCTDSCCSRLCLLNRNNLLDFE